MNTFSMAMHKSFLFRDFLAGILWIQSYRPLAVP
jgi:hypothetical protein